MLLLASSVNTQPIMSLQTGGKLAEIVRAVIDPADLRVLAYEVNGPLLNSKTYLRIEDVRELSDIGFIIDSIDEFVEPGDVIKLDEIIALGFDIDGMQVRDEKTQKVGKITDYTIDLDTFTVQQLSVRRPLLRSLNDTELLIHRSQIIEINDQAIVVESKAKTPEHTLVTAPGAYVNPFRKPGTAVDSIEIAER